MTRRDLAVPIGGARGFSLIELMVSVAIVAILAMVAIPSYSAYTIRAQRNAAKATLLQVAQMMERAFTGGYSSGAVTSPPGIYPTALSNVAGNCAAVSPSDSAATTYCVTMTTAPPAPAGGYLLSATPCGDASSGCPAATSNMTFVDATCDVLTLDNTGVKQALGAATTAIASDCWQR